ncbi:MAG: HNH endonuclease [Dehalococcoidia bacterium]|nr:HNH endonuclease [Dehalococcoidia bacterium]
MSDTIDRNFCSEYTKRVNSYINPETRRRDRKLRRQSQKKRPQVIKRDQGRCRHCGHCVGEDGEIDHVMPIADGGTADLENLQLLCWSCHRTKTTNSNRRRRKPPPREGTTDDIMRRPFEN